MASVSDDVLFSVMPYTKSGLARLRGMANALRRIDKKVIAGDVVECGVWQGGNIILARKLSPDRVCWLYDTFTGMTKPEAVDIKRSGRTAMESYEAKREAGGKWAGVSVEQVRANLAASDVLDDIHLRFVEGPVETTLLDEHNRPEKIALLRLDTDWHASTKIELEMLYPRLQTGGILIVDDYGHWMGAKKAVDDYFRGFRYPIHVSEFTRIDYSAVSMVKMC